MEIRGKGRGEIAKVVDHHAERETSSPYGELKDCWSRIKRPGSLYSLSDELKRVLGCSFKLNLKMKRYMIHLATMQAQSISTLSQVGLLRWCLTKAIRWGGCYKS